MTPDRLRETLGALTGRARSAACAGLSLVADMAAAEARRRLTGDGAPSRAGGGPGDELGRLAASLSVEPREDGAALVATDPAAVDLEYGTTRRAARPFLRPAVEAVADEGRAALGRIVADAVAAAAEDTR